MTDEQAIERYDRQVDAVSQAVAKLLVKVGPQGFTPEAIFEGAVRGGAVALLAGSEATATDVEKLLIDLANGFADLDRPKLRLVQ